MRVEYFAIFKLKDGLIDATHSCLMVGRTGVYVVPEFKIVFWKAPVKQRLRSS